MLSGDIFQMLPRPIVSVYEDTARFDGHALLKPPMTITTATVPAAPDKELPDIVIATCRASSLNRHGIPSLVPEEVGIRCTRIPWFPH